MREGEGGAWYLRLEASCEPRLRGSIFVYYLQKPWETSWPKKSEQRCQGVVDEPGKEMRLDEDGMHWPTSAFASSWFLIPRDDVDGVVHTMPTCPLQDQAWVPLAARGVAC